MNQPYTSVKEQIEQLKAERDELQAWKDAVLAVEAKWDPQDLAQLLGLPYGTSIHQQLVPAIQKLKTQATIFRVDALYYRRLVKSFLVVGATSAEDAAARVAELARDEASAGEPMYPAACTLSVAPVEFEVRGIEAL